MIVPVTMNVAVFDRITGLAFEHDYPDVVDSASLPLPASFPALFPHPGGAVTAFLIAQLAFFWRPPQFIIQTTVLRP